jgi:hypothetical protein
MAREYQEMISRESNQQVIMQETSDIYPPQRPSFNSKGSRNDPLPNRDPILDSTPSTTPAIPIQSHRSLMKETSGFCKPEESLDSKLSKIKNIFNDDKSIVTPRNNIPDQY